jgi:hypothetical protein
MHPNIISQKAAAPIAKLKSEYLISLRHDLGLLIFITIPSSLLEGYSRNV